MSKDELPQSRIPTLDHLGAFIPVDLDVHAIAKTWFNSFADAVHSCDISRIVSLLMPDAFWRDILALTWDFRTFDGAEKILPFLFDRLENAGMKSMKLKDFIALQRPYPDLAWIIAMFEFQTKVGLGTGVFRIVPTSDGSWKGHTIFTNLDDLREYPEKIGLQRSQSVVHGKTWEEERKKEVMFEHNDPEVIIIGAGHSGLELAARLKFLEVPTLVVDSIERIGDNWRNRYDALCLHWPIWFDHMAYIPFPPTWPKYSPSRKLADWLESYASALELNVWTSTTVIKAEERNDNTKAWRVTVRCRDGSNRTFLVDHLVFATGTGDGSATMPVIPEMDEFKGETLLSSKYKRASDYKGRKVVVIGAGVSGHDISADLANNGNDVTMFQKGPTFVMDLNKNWKFVGGPLYSEGSPPTEIADKLAASMPHLLLENGMSQRSTKAIIESDKKLLDGLERVGFKTSRGIKDTGFLLLLKTKGGGHYFNVGASDLIISGKIKLKNDSLISKFTPTGLQFEDGSQLPADVVIFATGAGELRDPIRAICGDEVADRCKPIWGLDQEGEFLGCWRDLGIRNLWYMIGSLQMARFHSKHLALQIKAIQANIFTERYSLKE